MAIKITFEAPGHSPKIKTHWNYTVRVTVNGKPASAKITAAIVDPIGGVHPVEFGPNTKKIINWPFKGAFSDYIIWPPESRGIPLTLRLTLLVGRVTKVITYRVTPRG